VDSPTLGFDLAKDETKTVVYTFTVNQGGFNIGSISGGTVYGGDEADANTSDNSFSFQARVLGGIGTTDGKLYDAAGGDPETAPGVAGATILLTNTLDATVKASGTTGADGMYHIADVPAGQYKLEIVPPAGWAPKDELGQIPVLAQNSPPAFIAMKRVPVPTT